MRFLEISCFPGFLLDTGNVEISRGKKGHVPMSLPVCTTVGGLVIILTSLLPSIADMWRLSSFSACFFLFVFFPVALLLNIGNQEGRPKDQL